MRHEHNPNSILHFLSGLEIGGKEAAALRLARRGIAEGDDHRLLLFDTSYRSSSVDFEPSGVPFAFIPRRGGLDVAFVWQLARYLGTFRPNVLQAYNDTAAFYAAAALKLQAYCTTKLIVAFHTWPSHQTRAARSLTCWACSTATDVVAVSSDLQERLCVEGWTRKCSTIPNGVDLNAFRPDGPNDDWRVRLNIDVGGILVGHIARFDEIKRHRDLLLAAKILEKECPEVVLALVGQGPLLDEMKELGAGRTNVRFVPQITPTAPFLRSLDIFVLCSEYEAAPLVLLEAMASGVASVVTPVGGIPEMIGGNTRADCAVQVPSNCPTELAHALARLARNPAERNALATRARQLSLGHSFEDEWRAYSALYDGRRTASQRHLAR